MSIGENIKKIRKQRGISQAVLAEQVSVTQSMIAQLERGTKTLTVPLGKQIADVLEVGFNDLLK